MAARVARPNALVIQCPDQVATMSEHDFMVELFKSTPKAVVRACQFLPKNYVRVTFKDKASRDQTLIKGVSLRGFQLNVFEADPKAALVYCYWVSVEVSTDSIRHALSAYGQVLECQCQVHPDFPDIESGVWIVRVKLTTPIPEVICILNFPCKIYYRGQPKSCRSCKKTGHLAKDCPFKDKCFCCGSADHKARNCTNAWNVPPAAAAPGPHPPTAPDSHPLTAPPPPPPADPAPPPPVAPGLHPVSGASQSVPPQVHSASPVSSPDPLIAGLPLVPDDSPSPFSGMPLLEKLPGDPPASSLAAVLDQNGFLVNQPSHLGAVVSNQSFSSSSVPTLSSTLTLGNSSVGGHSGSNKSNVGNPKGSGMSIVEGQKSLVNSNVSSSNVGSQKSSAIGSVNTVVVQNGPSLTYSNVVSQIANSNLPISSPPNSNPSNSGVQIPASNSVQNSVPNSCGLIPDVQIIGSNFCCPCGF